MSILYESERPPYEQYILEQSSGFGRTRVYIDIRWEDDIVFKETGVFVWKAKTPETCPREVTYNVTVLDPTEFKTMWDYFRRFWYGPDPLQTIVIMF
jgi:hypothetical protein